MLELSTPEKRCHKRQGFDCPLTGLGKSRGKFRDTCLNKDAIVNQGESVTGLKKTMARDIIENSQVFCYGYISHKVYRGRFLSSGKELAFDLGEEIE